MENIGSCRAAPDARAPGTRLLIAYTSSVSNYASNRDLGSIFLVISSLSVFGAIWCWFENLSRNPRRPPAVVLAAITTSPRDSQWWAMYSGDQTASSGMSSRSMLLLAAACSCVITYSTVTGYYWALGDAQAELFAVCYLGIAAIYHYQYLIFLVTRVEAPMLLSTKMIFELAIWSTATAFAMWVSSNSITLCSSQPGVLASDAGAFCMLLMMSRRFQQAGHGEVNIFSNCGVYHALLVNFIFRTSTLSPSPSELVLAMILYGFVNVVSLWDIGRAGATAYHTGSVQMVESHR